VGDTIHRRMLRETVNERCAQDARWAMAVSRVLQGLMDGYWDTAYVHSLVQKWNRYEYDIYDAYAFAQCHAALHMGKVLYRMIQVGAPPQPDNQVRENNRTLNQLPAPFHARFLASNQDDDGFLAWEEPVFFESIIESVGPVEIVPGLLPLEVGYTDGSRTLLHFAQERGVARWPYGSDTIYLYKVIDDTLWTPGIEPPPLAWQLTMHSAKHHS